MIFHGRYFKKKSEFSSTEMYSFVTRHYLFHCIILELFIFYMRIIFVHIIWYYIPRVKCKKGKKNRLTTVYCKLLFINNNPLLNLNDFNIIEFLYENIIKRRVAGFLYNMHVTTLSPYGRAVHNFFIIYNNC